MAKVIIQFCSKCKWHNRAVWYLQEIMQTFGEGDRLVSEISIQPKIDAPGLFQVLVQADEGEPKIIYKRKFKKDNGPQDAPYYYEGFPDSKLLKTLIRDELFPSEKLGHVDGHATLTCEKCEEK
ncbi:hypothetical protein JA9_001158 [Meyerozyma sp. JA9]|nr:hypothetical protein JA9_001158 [Meyerozyma sp. JA9]